MVRAPAAAAGLSVEVLVKVVRFLTGYAGAARIEFESGVVVLFWFEKPLALRTATGDWFVTLTPGTKEMQQRLGWYMAELPKDRVTRIRQQDLQFKVDRL